MVVPESTTPVVELPVGSVPGDHYVEKDNIIDATEGSMDCRFGFTLYVPGDAEVPRFLQVRIFLLCHEKWTPREVSKIPMRAHVGHKIAVEDLYSQFATRKQRNTTMKLSTPGILVVVLASCSVEAGWLRRKQSENVISEISETINKEHNCKEMVRRNPC
jgi:hypothetical protein